jgi:hypothetical protein
MNLRLKLDNCMIQHRGKTSAHASTLLKFALRTWCRVLQSERGVKYSKGCQKLKIEATIRDLMNVTT